MLSASMEPIVGLNNGARYCGRRKVEQSWHRRAIFVSIWVLLTVAACGGSDDTSTASGVNPVLTNPAAASQAPAMSTPAMRPPSPVVTPVMPPTLSEENQAPLLAAIASSYPVIRQLERKEESGHVRELEAARLEASMERARDDLAGIKRNLASLS